MTNPPDDSSSPQTRADAEELYGAVSRDARYGHYARIPERICRCLEYFDVASDRAAVRERLRSYYLFIGVADDAIDSQRLEAGREILEQLCDANSSPAVGAGHARAALAAEVLRRHIGPEIHALASAKFGELYGAVVRERESETMDAYIAQRRAVGRLTAELSYMLIRPLLTCGREQWGAHETLRRFFREVGEVGCLVDSVVDLRSDGRAGLLSFRPTAGDYLKLAGRTLREGLRVLAKHPRLLGLFLGGVGDVLRDRFRARVPRPKSDVLDDGGESGYACERAA